LATALVVAAGALGALALSSPAQATVITVSPGQSIANAVAGAAANDVIEIQTGTYQNDFPTVNVPLTIEAAPGSAPGSVVLDDTSFANNQGIITNNSTLTVSGLVIKGAHTDPGLGDNAGGIRDHGVTSLTVIDTILQNNQNGILTDDPTRSEVLTIVGSHFLDNGTGTGQTHALYVGGAASLDVENSTFCGTNNGHDIKSRATATTVGGSTMYIGAAGGGCASALGGVGVDLPDGGIAKLVNDSIIQGPGNQNGALVLVGGEALLPKNSLDITGTTLSGDNGLSGHSSIGVNELDAAGNPFCVAPVTGSGNTVSGLTIEISPAGCGSIGTVSAVDEPSPLWLLLTALGGGAVFLAADRRRHGRTIKMLTRS
jgi:hypothetical protein